MKIFRIVMTYLFKTLAILTLAYILITAYSRHMSLPGLLIYTDQETKCEYLGSANGGMTPRLNYAGRHAGCKPHSWEKL